MLLKILTWCNESIQNPSTGMHQKLPFGFSAGRATWLSGLVLAVGGGPTGEFGLTGSRAWRPIAAGTSEMSVSSIPKFCNCFARFSAADKNWIGDDNASTKSEQILLIVKRALWKKHSMKNIGSFSRVARSRVFHGISHISAYHYTIMSFAILYENYHFLWISSISCFWIWQPQALVLF